MKTKKKFLSGFSFTDIDNSQDSSGREGILVFRSNTSTRSRTFRHLFGTLHVRWLSYIFNRTACIYQTASRWNWPRYRITIWLIDDVKLVFVCLLDDLILGFCFSNLNTGNRETQTRIDYHPCIASKPTNQPTNQSPQIFEDLSKKTKPAEVNPREK